MLLVLHFTRRLSFVGTSLEMVVETALAKQAQVVFQILLAPTTFTFGLGCPEMGFLPGELASTIQLTCFCKLADS